MSTNYTDLEIFDIVADALIKQGQKAVDNDYRCRLYALKPDLVEQMTEAFTVAFASVSAGSYTDIHYEARCVIDKLSLGIYMSQPENTLRCAVGWLIAPHLYSRELENRDFKSDDIIDLIYESYPTWTINTPQLEMLGMLQRTHDSYEVDDWVKIFELARIDCFDQDGFFKRTKYGDDLSVNSFFDKIYDLGIYRID
ncbi:hypothetical protein EBU71_15305 [bacterium]|nr:hypothetical protein [Candidatus Elulimicrobium humile]